MGKRGLNIPSVLFVLLGLTVNSFYALQVEFFAEKNYSNFVEGFQKKPGSDTDCYDLGKVVLVESIKTDKCLILYENERCSKDGISLTDCFNSLKCIMYSYRVDKNTPQFTHDRVLYPWSDYRILRSFHVCSQERGGGPSLDVDYYDGPRDSIQSATIVRQWRNVCTCQNVPNDIRWGESHKISIDNHGNGMDVFSEENCRGKSHHLAAGDNLFTRKVFSMFLPYFDIQSFRPSGLQDCIKLDAKIFKFHFKNGTFGENPPEEKVKLAASGDIINEGPAETSEEYMISEKVTETLEFSIAEGYTNMHSAGTEAKFESKVEAGVPLIGKFEASASFAANYQYTKEDTGTNSTTHGVSTETTIQITKRVTVPGCNVCSISAYVKQAKNFPIDYDSYSHISGYGGGARLNANEIRGFLPAGVDYVRDIDEFTVEAITYGTMYAQYGVKTLIAVKCDPIPNCISNSRNEGPSVVYYEFPFEAVEKGALKSTFKTSSHTIGISNVVNGNYWNSLSESSLGF